MNRKREKSRTLTGSRIYIRRGKYQYFSPEPLVNPKTGMATKWHILCPVEDGELKARTLLDALMKSPEADEPTGDFSPWFAKFILHVAAQRKRKAPTDPARLQIWEEGGKALMSAYRVIAKAFKQFDLAEVTPADIAEFVDQWEGRRSAQSYRSHLSKFFAWCCRKGLMTVNPAPLFIGNGTGRAILMGGDPTAQIVNASIGNNPGQKPVSFRKLIIGKLSDPQFPPVHVNITSPILIKDSLIFSTGLLKSSLASGIVISDNAKAIGGSDLSFANAFVTKLGNDPFTYPLGDVALPHADHPLSISAPSGVGSNVKAALTVTNPTGSFLPYSLTENVNECFGWYLESSTDTAGVYITSYWNNEQCRVYAPAKIRVSQWKAPSGRVEADLRPPGIASLGQSQPEHPSIRMATSDSPIKFATVFNQSNWLITDVAYNALFFNPKIGVNVDIRNNQNIYLSFAISNKEPSRGDFIDNAFNILPKAEKLKNFEMGFRTKSKRYNFETNLYYMLYKDQLVLTGELNDVGAAVRLNVPDSYSIGVGN